MPRHRPAPPDMMLDLFPFLSILACTIGTLILLIIVMTMQAIGEQPSVTIVAREEGGQNQMKTPRYWECSKQGVTLHPDNILIPTATLQENPTLQKALQELTDRRDKEYLIVVLRPGGIEAFQQLRSMVESRGIDIGYEPLDEGWQLNLEETVSPPSP